MYLFGESAVHLTVEGLGNVTVQELGRSVREALNIPDSIQDVFAFWLCSPLLGKILFHTRQTETRRVVPNVELSHVLCRIAVEIKASALQIMPPVARPVVSVHGGLGGRHISR